MLMQYLETTPDFPQQFMVLRAVYTAVPFYIKRNYAVFDYHSLHSIFTATTDHYINARIKSAVEEDKFKDEYILELYELLLDKGWTPTEGKKPEDMDFPLMLRRSVNEKQACESRRSSRLQSMRL